MSHRSICRTALAFLASLLLAGTAQAQLFRTYLSIGGNDANPCTVVAPCRLLPAALAAVASGGEVWMLDSANYNTTTVNITKSVTILAVPGAVGSVVASSADAILIATAGVKVTLRNLVIVPLAGATGLFNGVHMSLGNSLVVEKCVVANMSNNGIYVHTASGTRVVDSTIRGSGGTGIWVNGTLAGTTTTLDIAGTTIDGNSSQGVVANSDDATATVKVGMRDSRVLQTANHGVVAQSAVGGAVLFSASNNILSNNGNAGLGAFGAGVKVVASGNTSSGNLYGFVNSASLFESSGDNTVRNNSTNVFGTITNVGTL
jgi:hypothetical protein